MTLHLRPEIAAGLEALANAQGLSVEDYLKQLVERELPIRAPEAPLSEGDGMVWENGLFVYRTGKPLLTHIINDAIRHSRDERSERILDDLS
ncbi:MAG TPA: hypothetical protein VKY85_04565 [Candidatus Angelobacter sp.]|nr:hypothetical protein [Candidatus Angelobacter sp.]